MISAEAKFIKKLKLIRIQIELDGAMFFEAPPKELKRLLGGVAYRHIAAAVHKEVHDEKDDERRTG